MPEHQPATVPLDPSEVFGSRLPLAQKYHDSLATDGSTRGFIGPREVPRLWERHLINCCLLYTSDAADE